MRVRINPYKAGSRSAKLLSTLSGWLRLRQETSFRPRSGDVVINWGDSSCPSFNCRVLNPKQSIINASNKLTAFERMRDAGNVRIPSFYISWDSIPVESEDSFVGRGTLTGHSGVGISIGKKYSDSLERGCQLYTQYIRKSNEYRIHVVNGSIIFTQRKARRLDCENPNWQVRNLENGFVFVAVDRASEEAEQQAVAACAALGLDFGAVDLVVDKYTDLVYVLEVNTACGLEERTAVKYIEAFKRMFNDA